MFLGRLKIRFTRESIVSLGFSRESYSAGGCRYADLVAA